MDEGKKRKGNEEGKGKPQRTPFSEEEIVASDYGNFPGCAD
mgnify:FL=1